LPNAPGGASAGTLGVALGEEHGRFQPIDFPDSFILRVAGPPREVSIPENPDNYPKVG
jgi:hypothetical protein